MSLVYSPKNPINMKSQKEINALLNLIDDPDTDVYDTVSKKIASFGRPIIPILENYWEQVDNETAHERIESIIHNLHFEELVADVLNWRSHPVDLFTGLSLVDKYNYPDFDRITALTQFEKIRKNVWLELNNYLTPLEQINTINSIFFNYFKHRGVELDYKKPDDFLLHKSLESKKGNAIINGAIYMCICQRLDIPVAALNIPNQFLLGYFEEPIPTAPGQEANNNKIKFFVDGLSGQIYSHKDVENYFQRANIPILPSYFSPMDNKEVVCYLLLEYSKCFDNLSQQHKRNELLSLINNLTQ